MRSFAERFALPALGLALFLGMWEAAVRLGLVNPFLPPPSLLPPILVDELQTGRWFEAAADSTQHYLLGLALGSGAGILLGLLAGISRLFEAAIAWVVRLLRPIPGIAWIPLAITLIGVSRETAVFIVAIGVIWINFFATLAAVQSVDRDLIEVAEAFGYRSLWQKVVKIVLPASLPGMLAGFRTGLGQAWMAVVAAELAGVAGLGRRMHEAAGLGALEVVIVYMVTIAFLYGLLDALFVMVRDRLLQWRA